MCAFVLLGVCMYLSGKFLEVAFLGLKDKYVSNFVRYCQIPLLGVKPSVFPLVMFMSACFPTTSITEYTVKLLIFCQTDGLETYLKVTLICNSLTMGEIEDPVLCLKN